MKIKNKKIGFILSKEYLEFKENIEHPRPMRSIVPDWYKKIPMFMNNKQYENDLGEGVSVKGCVPFLDAISSGYAIVTSQDIQVSQQFEFPRLSWRGPRPLVERKSHEYLPTPIGCSDSQFAWYLPFGIELPKNYSALYTHPLNRNDLPFFTSSGIIDNGANWGGSISFWIKKDFEGIIPMGTPMVQIIPFKRESWKNEIRDDLIEKANINKNNTLRQKSGYKKTIHSKKEFD
jgi:hypothetical protein